MSRIVRIVPFIYFFLFTCVVYFSVFLTHPIYLGGSRVPYYNYLIDALLHGRLFVLPQYSTYDLSLFHQKWYVYWGPAPILYIFSFYLLSGTHANDAVYTLFAGIGNIVLFGLAVKLFSKNFTIRISKIATVLVIANFAFCSPNFYLSVTPGIWSTEQVIAIFYLLIFYLFYSSFLQTKKLLIFFLAVLFYNLAWFSRYPLLFQGGLFFYPLIMLWRTKEKRLLKKAVTILAIVTVFFVSMMFIYNAVRFGNPFETGIHYQVGAARYIPFQSGSLFSPKFIPHNVYYYFINSLGFSFHKPYITIDPEGNNIFQCYPLLFLLFVLLMRKYWQGKKVFLSCALLVIGFTICFLMLYFATGWVQFGNRFILDIIPLAFLLTLFVIENIPIWLLGLLTFYGFIVNFLGILALAHTV